MAFLAWPVSGQESLAQLSISWHGLLRSRIHPTCLHTYAAGHLSMPDSLSLSSHPVSSIVPPQPLGSIFLGRRHSLSPAMGYSLAGSAAVHLPGSAEPSPFLSYSRNFRKEQTETKAWEQPIVQLSSASMLMTTESLLILRSRGHFWAHWYCKILSSRQRIEAFTASDLLRQNILLFLFLPLAYYSINLYISLYFLKQHLMGFAPGKQSAHGFEKLVAQHFENGTGRNSGPFKSLPICP